MERPYVFLGGTCGKNNWRAQFISELLAANIPAHRIFNPVVPDWTQECQAQEDNAKLTCHYKLFYIADPQDSDVPQLSTYSIVEALMGLYDDPARTIVVFDKTGVTGHALKSLNKIEKDFQSRFPGSILTRAQAIMTLLRDCPA
jgi:hypothetical protein